MDYQKSSIRPLRGLFDFGHSRGGLIKEGGLFKALDEMGLYDSFISLLPHILQIQDAILRVKYINLTDFIQNYIKIRVQTF